MHIEELSKSQLILLTILVNFVTSIATGILTVSLLDHAPAYVTQTVNRVVEHTIETVAQAAPAAVVAPPSPAPSTQDLVTAALAADASRIVSFYANDAGTSTPPLAVGTYIPNARAVATAALESLPKELVVTFSDGSTYPASLSRSGKGIVIYGFADDAKLPKMSSPTLLAPTHLKVGSTALAVSADGTASTGIVSRIGASSVFTTLASASVGTGSAVVDLSGNLIGIVSGATSGSVISAEVISALLTATTTAPAATSTPAA